MAREEARARVIEDSETLVNLKINDEGDVTTRSRSFGFDIQRGKVTGFSAVNKFGRNPDVDTANNEDIWDTGGFYSFPSAAGTVVITSGSANDTSAGTGARTVLIQGLDASFNEQEETITMNGGTGVNSVNTYIRLHRMIVKTAGSTGQNQGRILAKISSTTVAQISTGFNQTLMAIYTIPAGKTGYLSRLYGAVTPAGAASGTRGGDLILRIRPENEVFQTKMIIGVSSEGTTLSDFAYDQPLVLAAKTDIRVEYNANDNNTEIHAGFDIILEDD